MEPGFWLTRWQTNQTGFHEGAPNTLLLGHFAALNLPAGATVFVPLCGKSHDMLWLRAKGYRVIGAELSRLAVEQFFAELGVTAKVTPAGQLERFEAESVTIFVGDIFDLDRDTLGRIDAVYDRAALVALPDPIRRQYAAHLVELTAAARQLVVTFEYDQARLPGPPFSVPEAELLACYGAAFHSKRLAERDVPGGIKGLAPAQESIWFLTLR